MLTDATANMAPSVDPVRGHRDGANGNRMEDRARRSEGRVAGFAPRGEPLKAHGSLRGWSTSHPYVVAGNRAGESSKG